MIHYKIGDATDPLIKEGHRVIAHICNDAGKWGAGFSGEISKRWKDPEDLYRSQYRNARYSFKLGEIQWVFVDNDLAVVNMIAQHNVRSSDNPKPIRYEALESCLNKLAESCQTLNCATLHMPRIGCGLAGGDWTTVGQLVEEICWDLDVYVYDMRKERMRGNDE